MDGNANGAAVAAAETKSDTPRYVITVLAIGVIVGFRIFAPKDSPLTWTEIAVFALGVLPWLSAFLKSLKFGKDGVEFEFLEKKIEQATKEIKADVSRKAEEIKAETTEKINEVKESSEINQSLALGVGGGRSAEAIKEYKADLVAKADNPADPQKGKWGGSAVNEVTHRQLTVRVENIPGNDYFRRVILRVGSTDPANSPLTDTVTFHLHPTFAKPVIEVKPTDNAAEIKLVAYGAFTVGAETDNGQTKLELDIAKAYPNRDDPFFKR